MARVLFQLSWLVVWGCAGASSPEPRYVAHPTVIIDEARLILIDADASEPVPLEIHFELDSATIGEESHHPLEVLAAFITSHGDLGVIEVQGHTDEQGTAEYNMRLSERRARAVTAFLVGQGVRRTQLRGRGLGDQSPASDDSSPAGRARNRRVEFVITGQPEEQASE